MVVVVVVVKGGDGDARGSSHLTAGRPASSSILSSALHAFPVMGQRGNI